MKRIPSFSGRPGFPAGLRVLLVDADEGSQREVSGMLVACSYEVTCTTSASDALPYVATGTFDVLLAEASIVAGTGAAAQELCAAARRFPLVVIGDNISRAQVRHPWWRC